MASIRVKATGLFSYEVAREVFRAYLRELGCGSYQCPCVDQHRSAIFDFPSTGTANSALLYLQAIGYEKATVLL